MEKEELLKNMENLSKPDFVSDSHMKQLKLALLNTRKSAMFGIFLVIAPFLFALGAIFRYELGMPSKVFTWFFDFIVAVDPDSDASLLSWGIRFMLVGGPVIAVIVNLLAILHFQFDKIAREVQVTMKLRWLNITIILFCSAVFMIFFLYLLVENVNHP